MSADEFHHRLQETERAVERLQNNTAPTMPTYDSANWPEDAVPGQYAKDIDHNVWVHGEDGVWHQIGGAAYHWARASKIAQSSRQTVANDTSTIVTFNDFQTDAPTLFESDSGGAAIKVLQDGLYLITGRAYWWDWPTKHIVSISNIDSDGWAPYTNYANDINETLSSNITIPARLIANRSPFLHVRQISAASKDLSTNGSFIEIVRLGPANTDDTGFPYP